jgi:crossover junction endodeoxyribonuclease RuvC
MRILGIDPGLIATGWGIIEKTGSSLSVINYGEIKPNPKDSMAQRLSTLFQDLTQVFEENEITSVAIEETFVNKNPASALKLGMARGIAVMVPGHQGLTCIEYAPNQIKKSVVGSGHAGKEQIIIMVKTLLCIQDHLSDHSADALAVAITHLHHLESEKRLYI